MGNPRNFLPHVASKWRQDHVKMCDRFEYASVIQTIARHYIYGLNYDLRTGLVFYGRDHSADFSPFCGWDDILQTCFGQTGDVFNFLVDRTMTCWTRQL